MTFWATLAPFSEPRSEISWLLPAISAWIWGQAMAASCGWLIATGRASRPAQLLIKRVAVAMVMVF